jgi:hypothetical protein
MSAPGDVAIRERPILFSGPMVRAILDGRKTQTRRVVKLPRGATFNNCAVRTWDEDANELRAIAPEPPGIAPYLLGKRIEGQYLVCNLIDDVGLARAHCPYGQPGDRLWVRETAWYDRKMIPVLGYMRAFFEDGDVRLENARGGYSSKQPGPPSAHTAELFALNSSIVRRSAIHMPRWASRLTLEITNIRVERLQAITEEDALDEGVDYEWHGIPVGMRDNYRTLWDSLNAKRGYGWDVNPWVWVIEFRRVSPLGASVLETER